MRQAIKRMPVFGGMITRIYRKIVWPRKRLQPFAGSEPYWEQRYKSGGNSGVGSYGKFAEFKASVINNFVDENKVRTVIEFGCGDGNQLRLANYPSYLGFDVSDTAISSCREEFSNDKTKGFRLMKEYKGEKADLTLSLDVIYHLVEDSVFESYIRTLFSASNIFVIIYSSDTDDNREYEATHMRQRKFTAWIATNMPGWNLARHLPNKYPYKGDYREGSISDFFIYKRV